MCMFGLKHINMRSSNNSWTQKLVWASHGYYNYTYTVTFAGKNTILKLMVITAAWLHVDTYGRQSNVHSTPMHTTGHSWPPQLASRTT